MKDMASRTIASGVVLASAGSGKTFALSSRIIRLLLLGVGPERILASTFTRAAAGQILERVARRLADAAGDDAARRNLASHLGMTTLDAGEVRSALRRLAGALGSLSICTLDAFFTRLAGAHALELDLPPGWRIAGEDEDDRQRDEALAHALRNGTHAWWTALLRLLGPKRYVSGVARSLRRVVDGAMSIHGVASADAWDALGLPPDAVSLDGRTLVDAINHLEALRLPRAKSGEVNGHWRNAHAASVERARRGDWEAFVASGLPAKLAAGEESFNRTPIDGPARDAYEPLIRHARFVLLSRVREATMSAYDLLSRFDAAHWSLKRANGLYSFDDIPRALRRGGILTLEEIAYRLDACFDHVLLDEFQDTSITQFLLLEPLLEEILSGGTGADQGERGVLVVGDAKQSLYGWRQAEPELLVSLRARWPQLAEDTLARSYRSSPVVLDAVNRLFGSLPENPALREHPEIARRWRDRFETHTAARALPGHVRLVEVMPEDEGDRDDEDQQRATAGRRLAAQVEAAAQRVARLVREHPGASVGVLTRRRQPIPRLILRLRDLGVRASEEGGNPLTDSAAVAAIVSAMRLADHPGDSAAAFHVASSPLGSVLDFRDWDDAVARRRTAADIRRTLGADGYPTLIDRWRRTLAPSLDATDSRRVDQLVELARQFDARPGAAPGRFVELVERSKVDDPTGAAVRVMTIHRSKGQEFDAVILLDLDGRVPGKSPPLLTHRPGPFSPPDIVTRNPSKEVRALDPRLEALAQAQVQREVGEALGVLYVGMTRARHALEILVGPADKGLSIAGVLRAGLGATGGDVLFETDGPAWAPERGESPDRPTGPAAPGIALAARRRVTGHLTASRHATFDAALAFSSRARRARDLGTRLHEALSGVEWLDARDDGLTPTPAPGSRPDEDARDPEPLLRGATVRRALSREAYGAWTGEGLILDVRREVPFAVRGEHGLEIGRIDRLVLGRRGPDGPVERAEIIDFKTDEPGGRSLEQMAQEHRAQMDAYRAAVAQMTGLAPEAIPCVLLFLRVPAAVRMEWMAAGERPIIKP